MKDVSANSNWVRGFFARPLTHCAFVDSFLSPLPTRGRGHSNFRLVLRGNHASIVRTSTTATRPFSTSATASVNTPANSAGSNTGPLAHAP